MYFRNLFQSLEFLNWKRKLKSREQCSASIGPQPWPARPAVKKCLGWPEPVGAAREWPRLGHRAPGVSRGVVTRPTRRHCSGEYGTGDPWGAHWAWYWWQELTEVASQWWGGGLVRRGGDPSRWRRSGAVRRPALSPTTLGRVGGG
jgi:hypothetical protein